MTKILGLDLGTNSIGWAVVEKSDGSGKIIGTGVRIFPAGVEEKTIGMGEKEISKNATRRENRQSRRQFFRKKLRKFQLLKLLIEQEMCPLKFDNLKRWINWDKKGKSEQRAFPSTKEFNDWIRLNPYELRNRALTDEISLHEFGRILYHLIQRRGFLSSRKGKEDSTIFTKGKPDENILSINETKEKIENIAYGQYLYSILPEENEPYRMIIDEEGKRVRPRGRYTLREMYVKEFNDIWCKQSKNLKLDEKTTINVKKRKLVGSIASQRSKRKLEYLKSKYGDANVFIEKSITNGEIEIVTKETMPLKTVLAGKISFDNDAIKFKSNESVLFWQRPLRSQKALLADCRFETKMPVIDKNGNLLLKNEQVVLRSKKPCYLSHPEFELFRALQFINNIKFGKNVFLNQEQKDKVLQLINKKDKAFPFSQIPKLLQLSHEQFNYEDSFKVQGNPTIKMLMDLLSTDIFEINYEDLWHLFVFYDDIDLLYKKIVNDFGLKDDEKTKEKISKIKLKEGYSNVSLKAIRNIMPFLKMGYQFDRAVVLAGVKNAFGKRWDYFSDYHKKIIDDVVGILSEDNAEGEAIQKIKEYLSEPINHYGFSKDDPYFNYLYHHSQPIEIKDGDKDKLDKVENLRNPIVQKSLGEMRRLVNTLLIQYKKEYGKDFKFDRICVEMGRDLKSSKDRRQEMQRTINENEKKNDEARERLAEYGLKPSRENIHKYLLYKEIEERSNGPVTCPYSGKIVNINSLLGSSNLYQIEHIIPYSISLDDSFGNKTICESNFNRDKGEKTPYQYYCENSDKSIWGVSNWDEVEARAFRCLPYAKAKKFTAKKDFLKDTFIERQLNDTRYVSKKAKELLSGICKDVRVMPGQLTSELRHLWGLNNILQPIQNLDLAKADFTELESFPCYVVINNENETSIIRKFNQKPKRNQNEIFIKGKVAKKQFTSNLIKEKLELEDAIDGKYWLKIKLEELNNSLRINIDKPSTNENHIVLRGRVEKNAFVNETIKQRLKVDMEDGVYWAKFKVIDKKFEIPEKSKTPSVKKNQILLYGNVKDEFFKSYIYQCSTTMPDGKYWVLINIDVDNADFIKARNEKPIVLGRQIVLSGTVDENSQFVADVDNGFVVNAGKENGRYYFVYNYSLQNSELYLIENKPPQSKAVKNVIEGNIWVDKYTGEIKFDPKKNREDQRHHAIDAITIACTEQSYLQRLSTHNAQLKAKERSKLDSTEKFPLPWNDFQDDVKTSVEKILVSYHKQNKVLTKNKKGYSVRGQLHKEFVFGKRTPPEKETGYHIRKKLSDLKDNKQVEKIVDDTIKSIVKNHLKEKLNIDISKDYKIPNDAFFKDGKPLLYLPNTGKRRKDGKIGEPIPIIKVRVNKNIGNAKRLKNSIEQYVDPRNNHHVLIYKDKNGVLREEIVTFWEVVKRQLNNEKTYQLPEDGAELITTLEINDMFMLGLSNEEYEANRTNPAFISNYLYRIQKLSSNYYTFRHHLASTISNINQEISIRSMKSWSDINPIKVYY